MSIKQAYIIHDGVLKAQADFHLSTTNRSFLYGDSLFESMRIINGEVCFLENHVARILEGIKLMKMNPGEHFNSETINNDCRQLIEKCGITAGGKLRLTVFREEGGMYKPEGNGMHYILEAFGLEDNYFVLNEIGLEVDLFDEMKKPKSAFGMYKTGNCLPYIMAGIFCRQKELHDCLLLNEEGTIIEATSSNLFLVSNGVLYTPSLEEGCVAGTMRMTVINLALKHNMKVYEYKVTPQNLLTADEIFLTNAIRGIQWVGRYRSKRYFNDRTREIMGLLNNTFLNLKLDLEEN